MTCQTCKPEGLFSPPQRRGVYDFKCLSCCAALVAAARPSKRHQEAQLAAIARFKGSPPRAKILESLKKLQ